MESARKIVVGQRLKQAGMRWTSEGSDSVLAVLKPETWALLSLYLDPATGTASVQMDQKPQVSLTVDAEAFARIENIGIQCWLGDRRDLPEKGK